MKGEVRRRRLVSVTHAQMSQLSRCDHAVGPARLREYLSKSGQELIDRLANGRIPQARRREGTQDRHDGEGLLAPHNVLKKRELELHGLLRLVAEIVFKEGRELRSEEHTSELQSHHDLVCRLLLEK